MELNFKKGENMRKHLINLIILSLVTMLIITSTSVAYTPITNTCIGCHDGSIAQYKRPHNDTVMCEKCHTTDIHNMKYIQPNGSLGDKSTSATCIDCHIRGVSGFNSTIIPDTKHSSKLGNGSIWGDYWGFDRNNISCLYCHGDTKHDIIAYGKIKNLTDDSTNIRNGSINGSNWCADCHYNDIANKNYRGDLWNPVPPLINIKNTEKWVNHINYVDNLNYGDIRCRSCHSIIGISETSREYVHSIGGACVDCHKSILN